MLVMAMTFIVVLQLTVSAVDFLVPASGEQRQQLKVFVIHEEGSLRFHSRLCV